MTRVGLFVVLSVVVLVVTRPAHFVVVRTALVPAPPAVAFEKVAAMVASP